MEKFKVGDIVFHKITGEAVYILGEYSDGSIRVRRPTQQKDAGVVHVEEGFVEGELETEQEKLEREYQNRVNEYKLMTRLNDLVQAKGQDAPAPAKVVPLPN